MKEDIGNGTQKGWKRFFRIKKEVDQCDKNVKKKKRRS